MQVTETLSEGLKHEFKVSVPATDLDAKADARLVDLKDKVRLNGFRPGKVPVAHLKKIYGRSVMAETIDETIRDTNTKIFTERGFRLASEPKVTMPTEQKEVEELLSGKSDLTYTVAIEVVPPIALADFKSFKVEKPVVEVTDGDVDEAVKRIADQSRPYAAKAEGAKAETGDRLTISFKGTINGELFDGGTGEGIQLVIGSGQFIPGFEDQLIGAKAGEEVKVEVSFPEAYGAAHLAGKAAVFECTVKSVNAPKPAEIDDELAKKFGAEDLEALKGQIASRLEEEYKGAARAVLKRSLLDQLDGLVKFDLPSQLVDAEASQIAHQLWHEENPDHHGHDHGSIETTDEHKKLAERRVRLGLVLAEVGRKADVEVTDAEMTQAVLAAARQYPGQERQFFEFVQKNAQVQQQLRAPLYEDKVVDHIMGAAKVTEKEISKDELQKAVEALDEF